MSPGPHQRGPCIYGVVVAAFLPFFQNTNSKVNRPVYIFVRYRLSQINFILLNCIYLLQKQFMKIENEILVGSLAAGGSINLGG